MRQSKLETHPLWRDGVQHDRSRPRPDPCPRLGMRRSGETCFSWNILIWERYSIHNIFVLPAFQSSTLSDLDLSPHGSVNTILEKAVQPLSFAAVVLGCYALLKFAFWVRIVTFSACSWILCLLHVWTISGRGEGVVHENVLLWGLPRSHVLVRGRIEKAAYPEVGHFWRSYNIYPLFINTNMADFQVWCGRGGPGQRSVRGHREVQWWEPGLEVGGESLKLSTKIWPLLNSWKNIM